MRRPILAILTSAVLAVSAACSSDDDTSSDTMADVTDAAPAPLDAAEIAAEIAPAVDAVEADLGVGQEYFEITSTASGFVNVFVAVDDGTTAVPYLFLDGELQPPAPAQEGATGNTFTAADIEIDPDSVFDRLADELPETTVESLSVYGDGVGAVYVVAGRSEAGGLLDIVVGADGAVVSVDPV